MLISSVGCIQDVNLNKQEMSQFFGLVGLSIEYVVGENVLQYICGYYKNEQGEKIVEIFVDLSFYFGKVYLVV